jgi:hypothetical protein
LKPRWEAIKTLERKIDMKTSVYNRRSLLIGAGICSATFLKGPSGLLSTAAAQSTFVPTQTMRGGSNNYRPNAPLVENLGRGFLMSGRALRAETGEPLQGIRIQIWAATTRGGEREPSNHGSVITGVDGTFKLEMEQIVPNFGQPHGHLAYDDPEFKTVFLRPVMSSRKNTSLQADFVLVPT